MCKRIFLTGFIALLIITASTLIGCVSAQSGQQQEADDTSDPIRVMTFNIRYNTPSDGDNAWPNRKDRVAALIRFYSPDILGVQEALKGQMEDLAERLPEYAWIGVGRDDGKDAGEFSGIFYRTDRIELKENDTFWLSETPEVTGSKGWDAALPRIVTWAQFSDKKTGKEFYHFNTHFDHRGERAREESAALLVSRIQPVAGNLPAIVTGDFNFEPTAAPYKTMTDNLLDTYTLAGENHYGPEWTFSGFAVTDAEGPRIDYIYVREGISVFRHATLTDQWRGAYPSDHHPVLADLLLP